MNVKVNLSVYCAVILVLPSNSFFILGLNFNFSRVSIQCANGTEEKEYNSKYIPCISIVESSAVFFISFQFWPFDILKIIFLKRYLAKRLPFKLIIFYLYSEICKCRLNSFDCQLNFWWKFRFSNSDTQVYVTYTWGKFHCDCSICKSL